MPVAVPGIHSVVHSASKVFLKESLLARSIVLCVRDSQIDFVLISHHVVIAARREFEAQGRDVGQYIRVSNIAKAFGDLLPCVGVAAPGDGITVGILRPWRDIKILVLSAPILLELVYSGELGAAIEILFVAVLVEQIVAVEARWHHTSFGQIRQRAKKQGESPTGLFRHRDK